MAGFLGELPVEPLPITSASVMPTVSATEAVNYLVKYVEEYREEFERFTALPPVGRGYPYLRISPYIYSCELTCIIASDGYVIWDGWDIKGANHPITEVPANRRNEKELRETLEAPIARIGVDNIAQPDSIRFGRLPEPLSSTSRTASSGVLLKALCYNLNLIDILGTLFLGGDLGVFFARPRSGSKEDDYWVCNRFINGVMISSGNCYARYIHYAEWSWHVEKTAWDPRSIWVRVHADIARDYLAAISYEDSQTNDPLSTCRMVLGGRRFEILDRTKKLLEAIAGFEKLLEQEGNDNERDFHEFLRRNPLLLDAYGDPVSKPRWFYPEGDSPTGKSYIEPDFVIKYYGFKYKLIELESPSKQLDTIQGQPRSGVGQAAYQIAEWRAYLSHHGNLVQEKFPHITSDCPGLIVLGRDPESKLIRLKIIYQQQYNNVEVITYDEVLARAKEMSSRILSL